MKKCLLFIVFLSGILTGNFTVFAQTGSADKMPEFLFKKGITFDFKEVLEGPVAEHTFEFINNGNDPLVISDAYASCGCIVTNWTKEPVLPGKKGFVSVLYNTDGRVGTFDKDVYIKSNVKSSTGLVVLHIMGVVTPKDPERPATGY